MDNRVECKNNKIILLNYRYEWRASHWQRCMSCEMEFSTRQIFCVNITTDNITSVDEKYCNGDKPKNIKKCPQRDCPMWVAGKWRKV